MVTTLESTLSNDERNVRHFIYQVSKEADWTVMVGGLGIAIVDSDQREMVIKFEDGPYREALIHIVSEFENLQGILRSKGLNPTDPVMIWLRGVFHALLAENPNPIPLAAVLKATSGYP